jgi:large subunit ribosomal protein L29
MSNLKEMRDQSLEELQIRYQDLSREIFDLRNEIQLTRKLEKPHRMRFKKRERARVLTIIREKEGSV